MASMSGRPSTPPSSSSDATTLYTPLAESTEIRSHGPQMFDLIHAVSSNIPEINVDIPAVNLRAAAVDSSKLLGHGASFTASVQSLPPGPETVQYTTDHGTWKVTKVVTPPPRPKSIVYKTARVAFDDKGEAQPQSRSALQSVLTEIHALTHHSLFQHPNVIAILGFAWGTNEFNPQHHLPALVLEYADHGTLMDVLTSKTLPPIQSQALCFDVASGLEAIHAASLVHGDVKAENVLICSGETRAIAKLADFGYSVATESESAEVWIGGTTPWKAPETRGPIPVRLLKYTDVYSLGLLIWLVSIGGRSPFRLLLPHGSLDEFEQLKQDDRLSTASKVLNWVPKFVAEHILSDQTVLARKFIASRTGQIPDPSSSNIAELLQGFLLDWLNTNPLVAKLDNIFSHSLTLSPELRKLSEIRTILQQGVQPAEKHVSRRTNPKSINTTVLNTSGETNTYKQTAASHPKSFLPSTPTVVHNASRNEMQQDKNLAEKSDSVQVRLPRPVTPDQGAASCKNTLPSNQDVSDPNTRQTEGKSPTTAEFYDAGYLKSWKLRGYGGQKGSWQGMRKTSPIIQEDLVSHWDITDSGRQFFFAACKINGYGCQSDPTMGLQLIRQSADLHNPLSEGYFYRLHRACDLKNTGGIDLQQYLVRLARIGSRAALQDLHYAGMVEEAASAAAWLSNRTGGVGADWYADVNMLHGLTLGHWLDHEFLRSTAQNLDDINTYRVNKHGDTLLHMTAACGEHKSRKFIVEKLHADINGRNSRGETPLLSLCRAGQSGSAITFLRLYQADASLASPNGETPLHWLVSFPDQSIKPLSIDLVQNGAHVDAATTQRVAYSLFPSTVDFDLQMPGTPLLWAVHHDRPVAVEALLDLRANPLYGSDQGITSPIEWAAFFHHSECLKLMITFLEREHAKAPDHYGDARFAVLYKPLIQNAVQSADKFSMILRNGGRYMERLHATLDLLREKTALIRVGKDFVHKTWTLFYYAVAEAHDEVVEYLLDHQWYTDGLDEACGDDRRTPLLEAVRWNRRPLVELLIQHGADVKAKARNPFKTNDLTWTALHVFADEGFDRDISLISYLISLGVKVDGDHDQADVESLLPLHRLGLSDEEPAPLVDQPGHVSALTETPFSCALRNNSFKLCNEFISFGADPNALTQSMGLFESDFPVTILGHVIITNARYSHARLEYLLSLLAHDALRLDDESMTPLRRCRFIVEPARQLTALHRAALGSQGVHTTLGRPVDWTEFDWDTNRQIMRVLLRSFNSADQINAQSTLDGQTALHMAVRAANVGALQLLLEAGADKHVPDVNDHTARDLAVSGDANRSLAELACLTTMVQILDSQ